MKRLTMVRYVENSKCTIGRLQSEDRVLICYTLEPPQKGNPHRIPAGTYRCSHYISPRLKTDVWLLHNVPGYQGVEIHIGNYPENTKGCILPGMSVAGNRLAVWRSKDALELLTKTVGGWNGGEWELCIVDDLVAGV